MACDIDDREGESPSPAEPRLGRCSTARRPVAAVSKLFPRRSVFVKRFTHEMTLPEVPAVRRGQPGAMQPTEPSIASPARTRDPNRPPDRIRGDGRPSQNALPLKILRRPQPPEAGAQNDGPQRAHRGTRTRQGLRTSVQHFLNSVSAADPVQIPLSLLFFEFVGHHANAVQLHVYTAGALVRPGVHKEGFR